MESLQRLVILSILPSLAPLDFSIQSFHILAPVSDISPRNIEVYRMQNNAWVLAFQWVNSYDDAGTTIPGGDDSFHGTSNKWMLTIVDTYLTTASEYNDDLENFTYFTGTRCICLQQGLREYVAVKFDGMLLQTALI